MFVADGGKSVAALLAPTDEPWRPEMKPYEDATELGVYDMWKLQLERTELQRQYLEQWMSVDGLDAILCKFSYTELKVELTIVQVPQRHTQPQSMATSSTSATRAYIMLSTTPPSHFPAAYQWTSLSTHSLQIIPLSVPFVRQHTTAMMPKLYMVCRSVCSLLRRDSRKRKCLL
jgi:hypothetical protein